MGLIKAAIGALGGNLADQWKEYFVCDSLEKDVLVERGHKQTTSRSSNTKGNDNVISDGSLISIADGQCMIIVDGGKVVELCAEPGYFTYNNSTAPSIFTGGLGEGIKKSFENIGKRITFGGDVGADQRVYYVNTKELIDNKFGTPNPVPFRVVDSKIGFDVDLNIRCSGAFSYKIVDPILFYTNVCSNVSSEYKREEIDDQLKSEFISALQGGLGKLSDMEIRPNQVVNHTHDLELSMNEELSQKWGELRGLNVVSIAFNSVSLTEEDQKTLQKYQKAAVLKDPTMAAARTQDAAATAIEDAANNENGAGMGFMGMGLAMNAGNSMNAANLYEMGNKNQSQNQNTTVTGADSWKCECGAINQGNFCSNCGKQKIDNQPWFCQKCGTKNQGNFCQNCGEQKK